MILKNFKILFLLIFSLNLKANIQDFRSKVSQYKNNPENLELGLSLVKTYLELDIQEIPRAKESLNRYGISLVDIQNKLEEKLKEPLTKNSADSLQYTTDLNEQIKKNKQLLNEFEQQLNNIKQQIKQTQNQYQNSQNKIKDLEIKKTDLETLIKDLEDMLKNPNLSATDIQKKLLAERADLIKKFQESNSQVNKLAAEKSDILNKFKQLNSELSRVKSNDKISNLEAQIKDLDLKLRQSHANYAELENKYNSVLKELKEYRFS